MSGSGKDAGDRMPADSAGRRRRRRHAGPVRGARSGRALAALACCLTVGLPCSAAPEALRVGVTSLPPAYGNPFTAIGLPGGLTWQQLFDGLTRLDASGNVAGALAEEWELTDPLTWRFRLRRDAVYSNGVPFDGGRAKRVFDWLLSDEGRNSVVGNELRGVAGVTLAGPYELIFRTRRPDPILPKRLTIVMMVEPQAWRERGPEAYARRPVGTGSYVLKSWQNLNGAAELVKNVHSWRPPHIKTVEMFPLQDHAARFQAAISRQLHVAQSMRPEELDIFRERGFEVTVDASKQIIGIAFDVVGHPESPIADERVRQAINYAVDKDAISRIITYGIHRPASQGAAPGVFGYNPEVEPYPYDPRKAGALLREAGYPDGFSFTATIVIGNYANDVEIYQKVQQDLAAVGVKMTIEATVFSDWIRQYVTGTWRTAAFSLAWNTTPYNDPIRPMDYFSCKKARPFFCDRSMMPALERAATELETAERERILKELQASFHARAPSLFLLEYGHIWVSSGDVTGFVLRDRAPQLHRMKFETAD